MADNDASRVFKRKRYTGQSFTLRVGANFGAVEEFIVHEVVLKETSGFFQAAVKKEWKEGQQRVVEMPEDTPEVVSAYVDWLYSDKIFPKSDEPPVDARTHGQESDHLAKLYVFGEKNQDDAFCDAVITAWTRHLGKKIDGRYYWFPADSIRQLYAGTSSSSPARRFVVQTFVKYGCKAWLQEDPRFSQVALLEFLKDVVVEQFGNGSVQVPKEGEIFDKRREWFKQK